MPRQHPSSSKAVAASNWEGSDGSFQDEQEDKVAAMQSSVFQKYLDLCEEFGPEDEARDAIFAAGLARVAEYLSSAGDASTCLICLGAIRPAEAVWQCSQSCHAILHLPCLQEWARSQLEASVLRATSTASAERAPLTVEQARAAAEWGCPKCRHSYSREQLPGSYTCFCGKKEDPEWDPWLTPHTCGEVCAKPQPGGTCDHTCTLLCHPGPCPPCPRVITAACYCGKLRLRQRCGQQQFSCQEVCSRRLGCGHSCPDVCHEGPCPPCQQVDTYRCACGADSARLPCSQQQWHCSRPCNKVVACGRHRCQLVCHAGPCLGCPHSGARTCPCGKVPYPDLACDQAATSCGGTCDKLLACGVHHCTERCHTGECPKVCRDTVVKTCRCGKTQKSVQCHQEVLCERRCTNTRSCGRHPCKRRCCDGNCPPCEEVCHRKLRCGNHRCPAPCHPGPCRPCPLSQRVSCACGTTQYTLVCGAEAQAVEPRCPRPCPVPLLCRHAAGTRPHRCHYGPCPTCQAACGTQQPCGHACSSTRCHDPPPPPVADWQQPKPPKSADQAAAPVGKKSKAAQQGPGEALYPAQVASAAAAGMLEQVAAGFSSTGALPPTCTPCPPCDVPVAVTCLGGHLQQQFPCCKAAPFSCQQPCGQPLPCGHHTCSKACHTLQAGTTASGAAARAGGGEPCDTCTRPCKQPRSCRHLCPLTCHPGPCPPCEVSQSCLCHCSKTSLSFPCHQYAALQAGSSSAGAQAAAGDALRCSKPCHKELPSCRHPCKEVCHAGPCLQPQQCREEVTVRCECRRRKAKWPCHKVQAALVAAGSSREYDGTLAQKLLPCDAECKVAAAAAAKAKVQPERDAKPAASREVQGQQQVVVAATPAAPSKPSSRKMSRAEREALQAQRAAEQLQAERWQKRKRQIKQWAVPAVVLLVLLLAVKGVFTLLDLLDSRARAAWGTGAAEDEF